MFNMRDKDVEPRPRLYACSQNKSILWCDLRSGECRAAHSPLPPFSNIWDRCTRHTDRSLLSRRGGKMHGEIHGDIPKLIVNSDWLI